MSSKLTPPPLAVQVALALLVFPTGSRRVYGKVKGTYYEILAAFGLLTFAAIVLRLEVAGLLVPLALWQLWDGRVRLEELVAVGVVCGGASQGKLGRQQYLNHG